MNGRVGAVLEAFAVGDAMGMPTEFMTRKEITETAGGMVDGLLPERLSKNHPNLPRGTVTDDTEQVIRLLAEYSRSGRADPIATAACLLKWAEESGAAEKKYIGPSSLAALGAIRDGGDVRTAGVNGTTCGGIMRVASAILFKPGQSEDELLENAANCLIPTHNTSQSFEAAGAYAFALRAALQGAGMDETVAAAVRGAELMKGRAPYDACAASSRARIRETASLARLAKDELLDYLYYVWGTGLASADVCGAVFAIFRHAGKDAWGAIRMGASVGGDTDTIAALSGALCVAHAGEHNIPRDVLDTVLSVNALNISALAEGVL